MALTPRGFEDVALDKMVTVLTAYVTAQKADYATANPSATDAEIAAAVGFTVERDRLTPPDDEDLKAEALVVLGFDSEVPTGNGGKQTKSSTATFYADFYAARGEQADGLKVAGDKGAGLRLLYGKAQIEAALFDLANFDVGFAVGTIKSKPFGRWQNMTGTDQNGELWQVSGRWTFEWKYEWAPTSPQGVALEELSVTVKKSEDPTGDYSTRWAALYDYTEEEP